MQVKGVGSERSHPFLMIQSQTSLTEVKNVENNSSSVVLTLPEPSHVGYVTKDIIKTMADFEQYFGLGPFKEMIPDYFNKKYRGEPEDFRFRLAFARAGHMVYEVIEVIGGRTIYEDFMKVHGEGMHHLGYEISDLAAWIESYRKTGIAPIMSGERRGLKWAYLETPHIVAELLERTAEGVVV